MCTVDFDPPVFYLKRYRTSRKSWKCSECWREFEPGSTYLLITGKWDLTVASFKRCEACCEIADLVDKAGCSWAHGSLEDDAKQTIDPFGWYNDAPPEVIGRIIGLLWKIREERELAYHDKRKTV